MESTSSKEPSVMFKVQKILGMSLGSGNVRTYQVQWEPVWVSGVHLVGCEHLIHQFLEEQKDHPTHTTNDEIQQNDKYQPTYTIHGNAPSFPEEQNTIEQTSEAERLESFDTDTVLCSPPQHREQQQHRESSTTVHIKEEEEPGMGYHHNDHNHYEGLDQRAVNDGSEQDEDERLAYELANDVHSTQDFGFSGFSDATMCGNNNENKYISDDYNNTPTTPAARRKRGSEKQLFHCTECGKVYKHRYQLRRHMPVHIDGLRHRCQLCEKVYARKDSLVKHVIYIHGAAAAKKEERRTVDDAGDFSGEQNGACHQMEGEEGPT